MEPIGPGSGCEVTLAVKAYAPIYRALRCALNELPPRERLGFGSERGLPFGVRLGAHELSWTLGLSTDQALKFSNAASRKLERHAELCSLFARTRPRSVPSKETRQMVRDLLNSAVPAYRELEGVLLAVGRDDRGLIASRLCLFGPYPLTFDQVAGQIGHSREWARQNEQRAIARLAEFPRLVEPLTGAVKDLERLRQKYKRFKEERSGTR